MLESAIFSFFFLPIAVVCFCDGLVSRNISAAESALFVYCSAKRAAVSSPVVLAFDTSHVFIKRRLPLTLVQLLGKLFLEDRGMLVTPTWDKLVLLILWENKWLWNDVLPLVCFCGDYVPRSAKPHASSVSVYVCETCE